MGLRRLACSAADRISGTSRARPLLTAVYKCAYTTSMDYEWDPAKSRSNFAKHGIHFADAVAVLEDDLALTQRDSFSEEEERWITLGRDGFGRLLVVVYAWRSENIRLISARPARPREAQEYEEHHET